MYFDPCTFHRDGIVAKIEEWKAEKSLEITKTITCLWKSSTEEGMGKFDKEDEQYKERTWRNKLWQKLLSLILSVMISQ